MKKSRITRTTTPAITSRLEAEQAAAECASLINSRRAMAARMDEEIANLKEVFSAQFVQADTDIDRLTAGLQQWAETHPEEFGKRRSLELPGAVIGFRIHPPKLKTLAKWTFKKMEDILAGLDWGAAYLRIKQTVDKEAILRDIASGTLSPEEAKTIGVKWFRMSNSSSTPN